VRMIDKIPASYNSPYHHCASHTPGYPPPQWPRWTLKPLHRHHPQRARMCSCTHARIYTHTQVNSCVCISYTSCAIPCAHVRMHARIRHTCTQAHRHTGIHTHTHTHTLTHMRARMCTHTVTQR